MTAPANARMNSSVTSRRIALIAICLTCLMAAGAFAQEVKIGIVNPAKVFADMQETKDLKAKLDNDRKALEGELTGRQQKVKDLLAARDLLKPDSPQYQEADAKYTNEAIQFDNWSKFTQVTLQGQQKQQMKTLFDKIVSATGEVAQQKGLDLVLADQRPDTDNISLSQLTVEQVRGMLNSRNILFSNDKVDLNAAVTAALDAKYKSMAPAGAAPPPQAPLAPPPAK